MKHILVFLSVMFCCTAWAEDLVAKNGDDSVRLTQSECPSEILKLLPAIAVGRTKLAIAVVSGVEYRACWMPYGDLIALKYEDDDNGLIPEKEFQPAPNT